MMLRVLQFNFGHGGGSSTVYLVGDAPGSHLDKAPYRSIDIMFAIRREPFDLNQDNQLVVRIPGNAFLLAQVTFNWDRPMNADDNYGWPDQSQYRPKIAHMIANMIALAELRDLSSAVPTVLCN